MAALDVDEVVAGALGATRGTHVCVGDLLQLLVAHERAVRGLSQPRVEYRMHLRPQRPWQRRRRIGPRKPARVGQLQADHRSVAPCSTLLMSRQDFAAERLEPRDALVKPTPVNVELVRVGTPFGHHGHRLPAPDQLRTAQAEPPPTPPRQVARTAVPVSVPTLHRMDREPVAGLASEHGERLRQRPLRTEQLVAAVERRIEPAQMLPEGFDAAMVARRRVAPAQPPSPACTGGCQGSGPSGNALRNSAPTSPYQAWSRWRIAATRSGCSAARSLRSPTSASTS